MILIEVEQRHQGSMLNLFKHLRKLLTEKEKVDLVMINISPYLADRVALVEIYDTHHLVLVYKKFEDVINRSKKQQPKTYHL